MNNVTKRWTRAAASAVFLLLPTSLSAEASVEETWKKYTEERKSGLTKLGQRMVASLEKMQVARTKEGDLEGAIAVRNEIARVKAHLEKVAATAKEEPAPAPEMDGGGGGSKDVNALIETYYSDVSKGLWGLDRKYAAQFKELTATFLKARDIEKAKVASEKMKWLEAEIALLLPSELPKRPDPPKTPDPGSPSTPPTPKIASGTNVALGARAQAPGRADVLTDGKAAARARYAWGSCPCEFVVTLDQVYELREIKLKLYEYGRVYYFYKLFVSEDGENWDLVADQSRRQSRGWQAHTFLRRKVKAIKVEGILNSSGSTFRLVEIEAYPP